MKNEIPPPLPTIPPPMPDSYEEKIEWFSKLSKGQVQDLLNQKYAEYQNLDRSIYIGVQIRTGDDCCPACKLTKDKVFDFEHIPVLPNPGCTHKYGCRCTMYPFSKYSVLD